MHTVAGVPFGTNRKRRYVTRAGTALRKWTLGHEHKLLVSESEGNPHMIQGKGEFAEGFRGFPCKLSLLPLEGPGEEGYSANEARILKALSLTLSQRERELNHS